jgi:hypothetical protein
LLKIKNSSVYFNYPVEVTVFEGANSNGMSWFKCKNRIFHKNEGLIKIFTKLIFL